MGDGSPPDDAPTPGDGVPDEGAPRGEAPPVADQPDGDGHAGSGGPGLLDQLLVGLAIAGVVALLLFGVSGVWPPMVAVQSGSMEPHLYRGDLVFVVEEHRFGSAAAVSGTGVVPARIGEAVRHESLGAPGDVIVYRPDGRDGRPPIIHRAEFWVNDSENWYDKANPEYLSGESCEAVPNCPAPHAGFVTKGDNNDRYDQVVGISEPVRPSWIKGTAEHKVPYLGRVRLALGSLRSGLGVDLERGAPDVARATATTHTSTTSTNATSIDAVRSTWTTAEPRTPTTA